MTSENSFRSSLNANSGHYLLKIEADNFANPHGRDGFVDRPKMHGPSVDIELVSNHSGLNQGGPLGLLLIPLLWSELFFFKRRESFHASQYYPKSQTEKRSLGGLSL